MPNCVVFGFINLIDAVVFRIYIAKRSTVRNVNHVVKFNVIYCSLSLTVYSYCYLAVFKLVRRSLTSRSAERTELFRSPLRYEPVRTL